MYVLGMYYSREERIWPQAGLASCFVLVLVTLFLAVIPSCSASITFKQECGGHLMRAAQSNTIEMASSELNQAIKYLESNKLTSGYTSVFYQTPEDDIGFWYRNLVSIRDSLKKVPPEASPLERSNVLLKVHESLVSGDRVSSLIEPPGISFYPNIVVYTFGIVVFAMSLTMGLIFLLFWLSE